MTSRSEEVSEPEREALSALDRSDFDGALGVLMREYGTSIYRYCREMVADPALAEEAHQTTFVKAYQSLPKFARRSSLRTWLFSIARHRCLDAIKIDRRRQRRFEPMDKVVDSPGPGRSVEDRLADRSLVRALEDCLRSLAPRVREVVLLRFQQGLSYQEITELSGESAAALRVRVARAMPVLRRCLESRGLTL